MFGAELPEFERGFSWEFPSQLKTLPSKAGRGAMGRVTLVPNSIMLRASHGIGLAAVLQQSGQLASHLLTSVQPSTYSLYTSMSVTFMSAACRPL